MIYVNGASWAQRSNIDPDYSWPSILQSHVKCQVVNQAAGCGSNSRILANLYKLYQIGTRPSLMLIALCIDARWHFPSRMGSTWSIGPGAVINDRFFKPDFAKVDDLSMFFIADVYSEIEYTYQMYNQIWQIQELAKNYFKCPVIFFNTYSNEEFDMKRTYNEIHKDSMAYVLGKVDEHDDYSTQEYIRAFEFFKTKSAEWHLELDSWSNLVYNHIDDEKGIHPGHPSPEGHKIICNSVLSTIEQKYPLLYKELI